MSNFNVYNDGSYKKADGAWVYHNGEWIEFGEGGPVAEPTIIASVLTQEQTNANRFTGNSFATTITATESPTKLQMKAEVVGALSEQAGSSPIVTNDYDGNGGIPLTLELDPSADFKVDDVVQANTTYTPESSEIVGITNVSNNTPLVTPLPTWQPQDVQFFDIFSAKGITAISGLSIFTPSGYGSAFDSTFTIDGVNLRTNQWATVFTNFTEVITQPYNGTATFSNFLAGFAGYVQQDGPANTQAYCTFDPIPFTNSIVLGCTNYGNAGMPMSIRDQAGKWWTLAGDTDKNPGDAYAATLLEFTDETDLNLFQAGDAVQRYGNILTSVIANNSTGTTYSSNSIGDMVNNTIDQGNTTRTSAATNKDWNSQLSTQVSDTPAVYTFDPPLELKSNETLWMWYVHQNNGIAQWIGGVNSATTVGPTNYGASNNTGYVVIAKGPRTIDNVWGLRIENTTNITDLVVTVGSSAAIGYAVNELGIPASFNFPTDYFTSVYPAGEEKIISTDPDNNKMVVSGGEWGASMGVTITPNYAQQGGLGAYYYTVAADDVSAGQYVFTATGLGTLQTTIYYYFETGTIDDVITTVNCTYTVDEIAAGYFKIFVEFTAAGTFTVAPSGVSYLYCYNDVLQNYTTRWNTVLFQPDETVGGATEVTTTSPKRGMGTIESITGTAVVINPFTDNCFRPTQWLTRTTPLQITPKAGPIASSTATTVTFDGPEGLLNFANGDAVTMCNSDGTPASVTVESSEIIDVVSYSTYLESAELFSAPMNSSNPIDNFLDANTTTFTNGGNKIVIKGLNISGETSLRIYGNGGSSDPTTCFVCFNKGLVDEHTASYNTTQSSTWNTASIPNGMVVKSFEFYQSNNIVWVSAMAWSDEFNSNQFLRATYGIAGGTILTFADGTDLDKFPVGTVVQSKVAIENTTTTGGTQAAYPISNIFDEDTENYASSADTVQPTFTFDFGNSFADQGIGKNIEVRCEATNALLCSINGGSFLTLSTGGSFEGQLDKNGYVGGYKTNEVKTLAFRTNGGTLTFRWIKVNGILVRPPVTVTDDSDIGNNKLTVSGGEWALYNTSETWSDNVTNPNGAYGVAANAFDGNLNTQASPANSDPMTFTYNPTTLINSLEVYSNWADKNGAIFDVNGSNELGQLVNKNDWNTITGYEGQQLSTIKWAANPTTQEIQIKAIRLNGKILVDGPWNQSQVWSDDYTGDWYRDPAALFDGNTELFAYANGDNVISVNNIGAEVTQKLEVYGYASGDGGNVSTSTWTVNGTEIKSIVNQVYSNRQWFDITSLFTTPFTLESIGASNGTGAFSGVRVDGSILVNKGIGGDTELSITQSGTGTVSTVDAPNNQITLTGSNNQWQDDYYMKGPIKNAVEMTAYLNFNQFGQVSSILPYDPGSVLMNSTTQPTLIFPDTFGTGEVPDTELPSPTYLQTTISAGNVIGYSPEVKSNVLYPATTGTYTIPVNSSRIMKDEFGEFAKWARTVELRTSQNVVANSTSVAQSETDAETTAQTYIDSLP